MQGAAEAAGRAAGDARRRARDHGGGFRTRERNRDDARERLVELIRRAAEPPKRRRPTRPTAGSRRAPPPRQAAPGQAQDAARQGPRRSVISRAGGRRGGTIDLAPGGVSLGLAHRRDRQGAPHGDLERLGNPAARPAEVGGLDIRPRPRAGVRADPARDRAGATPSPPARSAPSAPATACSSAPTGSC